MKKLKELTAYILLIICFCSVVFADCRFFIGEESGQLVTGIESKVKVEDFFIRSEWSIIGIEDEYRNNFWWRPGKTRYLVELNTPWFVYEHWCIHEVDEYKGEPEVIDEFNLKFRKEW